MTKISKKSNRQKIKSILIYYGASIGVFIAFALKNYFQYMCNINEAAIKHAIISTILFSILCSGVFLISTVLSIIQFRRSMKGNIFKNITTENLLNIIKSDTPDCLIIPVIIVFIITLVYYLFKDVTEHDIIVLSIVSDGITAMSIVIGLLVTGLENKLYQEHVVHSNHNERFSMEFNIDTNYPCN
ncbi:hypothetical protein lbkm_1309 [Lachnospiraceae bacterium KM106-2]|nr:hypothetical protein lbkm_1309 [Lachnospiraceae bacterium KM106-2]